MKKVAILAKNLNIGGVQRALINYLNYIDKIKYEVYLFLEEESSEEEITSNLKDIHIVNMNVYKGRNVLKLLFINMFKRIKYFFKYHNKFEFAASFSADYRFSSNLARFFSKNNAIWYHGEYWDNSEDMKDFIVSSKSLKYKNVIFVSNSLKDKYLSLYCKQNLWVINNPINHLKMIKYSQEEIDVVKTKKTLLHVGRHEENRKKISSLLLAVDRLKKDNYDFELWLVGDGIDHDLYVSMVNRLELNDYVKFYGMQDNVYPFYKICDAVVLTSKSEGNPVVYLESKVMNKPVLSTNVADAKVELEGYGIVFSSDNDSIYKGIKEYLDNGYEISADFDPILYNREVINTLCEVIEDK